MKTSELRVQLSPFLFQEGSDRWYSATCPYCYTEQTVDVLGSETAARLLVINKVISHVKLSHRDRIEDDDV